MCCERTSAVTNDVIGIKGRYTLPVFMGVESIPVNAVVGL